MYYTWYTLCLAFSPVKFHVLISYREGSLQELWGQQSHQREKDSGDQLHSTELYNGAELVVSGVLQYFTGWLPSILEFALVYWNITVSGCCKPSATTIIGRVDNLLQFLEPFSLMPNAVHIFGTTGFCRTFASCRECEVQSIAHVTLDALHFQHNAKILQNPVQIVCYHVSWVHNESLLVAESLSMRRLILPRTRQSQLLFSCIWQYRIAGKFAGIKFCDFGQNAVLLSLTIRSLNQKIEVTTTT